MSEGPCISCSGSDGRGSLKCLGLAERVSDHAEALEVSGAAVSATQKV